MPYSISINGSNLVDTPAQNIYQYNFPSSVRFKEGDRVSLQSASLYYSWINISEAQGNNTYSFNWFSGAGPTTTNVTVTLPDGNYSLAEMNAYLQSVCVANNMYLIDSNGDYVYYLEIVENSVLYSAQLNVYPLLTAAQITAAGYTQPSGYPTPISAAITPQFVIPSTNIQNILGINAGTYPSPTQATAYSKTSDFTPQVSPVSSVFIRLSLLNNQAASPNDVLYNFSVGNTAFGGIVSVQPPWATFQPIQVGTYPSVTVKFSDQDFNDLNIQDTALTVILAIELAEEREVKMAASNARRI